MDLSEVHWLPVASGAAAWALALALIWLRFRAPGSARREADFARWKAMHGAPDATFGEFQASEEAPGIYVGRGSLCIVISVLALLALFDALRRWGVFA
jgi:hypothetical protein